MTLTGKVYLIGAGPGDPELLTLRALRMLEAADTIVYDRLVSPEILALAPTTATMVSVGKAPNCHPTPQNQINDILTELALEGQTVARLKGGDPMIFGRGSEEAAYLQARGITVEYAPGISAAQGMAAATGVPLTHRGLATGVRYVTGHLAANKTLNLNWESLADIDTTLVVYMGAANIAEIALRLIGAGLPANLPVLAVSNATRSSEIRVLSHLGQIGVDTQTIPLRAPVLFVIGRVVSLYQKTLLPTAEASFSPAAVAGE